MVKTVILCSNFVVKSKVKHFDIGKFVFWPWSWLKWVFLWLNFLAKFKVHHHDPTMQNLDFGHGHGRNFDHLTIVISKFW